MNHKNLLVMLLLVGLLAACGGQTPQSVATTAPAAKVQVEGGAYTNITPQQLADRRMSAIAAEELVKDGYANVWNLDGGMAAWEQQGFPLKEK